MKRRTLLLSTVAAAIGAAACGSDAVDGAGATKVTLVTHESFSLSDTVLEAFTADSGFELEILAAGDAGTVLNQSILTAGNPLGDVIFGVDTTFMSRALDADITEPYDSPLLDEIPDAYELDPTNRLLPVDVGDVCINIDVNWFADAGIAPPVDLASLTRPEYRDLLVVQNPATSSPGLAFMMATIAEFGTSAPYSWIDYWADLRRNGVRVSPGWTEAYYGEFTHTSEGDRPIVVSYASSPPAEVFFAESRPATAPTAVLEATCLRQQEFVGILAGTDNREGAEAFVDFLLSASTQTDIPWNMFVFPVNENATLPAEFVEFSVVPANPLSVPAADIEANREAWIDAWTSVVTG